MTVPDTLDEALSPAWLSSVLGVEVTDVEPGPVDNRVSTNAPVHVECADGRAVDLWIKGYFTEIGRAARHAGVSEAMFYRELAATLGVRTLRSLHAEVDPTSSANVVVTEDVVGQGAVFLDARSPYTIDQAMQSIEQVARLHAATWLDQRWGSAPWLAPRFSGYTVLRGVDDIAYNFDGPIGARVPEAVRDAERLFEAYKLVADDFAVAEPWCVVHGDPHVGNVFLDGDGRPSLVDWQLVQRGPWYVDVGYHIASALTVDDRRRGEAELLRHYLDQLAAGGVDVPPDEEVQRGLRLGLVHGFYLWAITRRVEPAITTTMLERLGTAVHDHDALGEVIR